MKSLIQIIFCFVTMASWAQSATKDSTDIFNKKLNERSTILLDECVSFKEVAGISAGIYKDGKVVWSDAAGQMDIENNVAANKDMVHRIASISKPMTAIAILQLMEQGLLNLDDPIQKHIPDFPLKKEGTITIKHLLEHSSGIKAYKNGKEGFPTKNYPTLREAVSLFEDRSLAHNPGQGYQYTTYGYVILGLVIENVSGISYRNYMKKNIWDKAGMTNTEVEIFGQSYVNKSLLYTRKDNGEIVKDKLTNLSVKVPGGGIQSTVLDLLNFAEAVLENKLLSPESSKLMFETSGHKKRGNPYGLGWFLYADQDRPSGRIIGHSGSQSGTSTQLFIFLDKKIAVAVLANTAGAWNHVFNLTDKLSDALVRPEDVNKPIKKVVPISNEILDRYVGKYKFPAGENVKLSREGNQLYGELKDSGKFKLYPESENKFFMRVQNIQIEFEQSVDKAKAFYFFQNGEKYLAKR